MPSPSKPTSPDKARVLVGSRLYELTPGKEAANAIQKAQAAWHGETQAATNGTPAPKGQSQKTNKNQKKKQKARQRARAKKEAVAQAKKAAAVEQAVQADPEYQHLQAAEEENAFIFDFQVAL